MEWIKKRRKRKKTGGGRDRGKENEEDKEGEKGKGEKSGAKQKGEEEEKEGRRYGKRDRAERKKRSNSLLACDWKSMSRSDFPLICLGPQW